MRLAVATLALLAITAGCAPGSPSTPGQTAPQAPPSDPNKTLVVAIRLEPLHLVEHRGTGNVEHAADDDPAMLAGRVEVDRLDHPLESHGSLVA